MAVSQKLYVTQLSQDLVANTSRVQILWQSTQTGDSYNINTRTAYYYVSINGGSETKYAVEYTLPKQTTTTVVNVTLTVPHTDVGKGAISVRTYMDTRISAGVVQLTKSLNLDTIARASTIRATDANIGSVSSVVIARKNSTYTHTVQFKFEDLTGYLAADGSVSVTAVRLTNTSIAFAVPESFYAQIPNSKYGVCTLICKTYSGSTQIGAAQTTTFKASTTVQSGPTTYGTAVDINPVTLQLTGNENIFVRSHSKVLCTINASAKDSATLVSKKINWQEVGEDNTLILENVESNTFIFQAVDSRGYSSTSGVTKALVEYIKLTANVQVSRDDPTSGKATVSIKGDFYNGDFGAQTNILSLKYRVLSSESNEYSEYEATITGHSYSAFIPLENLDYRQSYSIQVLVEDRLSSVEKTVTVSQGIPVFDWGSNDFRINVPLLLTSVSYGDTLPTSGTKGQLFLLRNTNASGFTLRVHNGTTWL